MTVRDPVQNFFEAAVRGYMVGSNEPLSLLLAVEVPPAGASPSDDEQQRGRIAGFIISQVVSTETCSDKELVWPESAYPEVRRRHVELEGSYGVLIDRSPTRPLDGPQVLYILTLGTRPEYRRKGLGRSLLRR
jgi:ribosomal protein S18 acetylase RimI-like enzyme